MQQELLEYVLSRLAGPYLIMELLILALNQIPNTPEKWKAKMYNVLRRAFYYLALNIAVVWIATL